MEEAIREFNENFERKFYYLENEYVYMIAKEHYDVANVLRGLSRDTFLLMAEPEASNKIDFIFIAERMEYWGYSLSLQIKEENFYDYLLKFSMILSIKYSKYESIGIYNSFLHVYRTYLEQIGIQTFSKIEMLKLPLGEIIFSGPYEIIKDLDQIEFYRKCLGEKNYKGFKENTSYVYIMFNKENGLFKIGYSKNPEYREATLQSSEPKIVLLKAWECSRDIEAKLHNIYKDKRVRGEWFNLHFEDIMDFETYVLS